MKRLFLLFTAIFMAAATGVSAKGGQTVGERFGTQDTIVVKMPNGAKMVLYLDNMQQLQAFRNYSLDSLITVISKYASEVDNLEKTSKATNSQQMTVTITPSKAGGTEEAEQVTITVQGQDQNDTTKTERHEIRINKNIKIDVEVREDGKNTRVNVNTPSKSDSTGTKKEKPYKSTRYGLDLDLGLNTFMNQSNQDGGSPVPDLKPLGSRYVSINWRMNSQVGGRTSPFYIISGLEFAFNNYMFDRNYVIEEDVNDNTYFRRATDINYQKSKLTHSSVNLPIMPMLKFKKANGKEGFKIGAGGFAGYRLGSHSKLKYSQDGSTEKDKVRSNYNLSDFQYGLTGVIGYGNLDLFVKYNMNSLFKDDRGPDVNVISFGFRLL
ncbi:PorT family protein [Pontibacter qinzhouensis]|uniref:PorT family protein n=1 Tax=Pontibacter qinzhouensis TaxID=2603253 RepID=A0A5C8IVK1_9BACT|nr:outer membrane beta-barrel protein [Pontibacter qinzhouensis]TXK25011.1 PorT family protein [Pontibacter qinzhouensis]